MSKEKSLKVNYINNKEFYEQLKTWYATGPDSLMPNQIARAIMQICENLSRSGRFVGYTWREDMVQDAILVCVRSARKFNPEKSDNPFAYFTQIAYNAFKRYLNIEHARLAAIESYKQSLDITYESDCDDDDYNHITETAKSYDFKYQKNYEVKKKAKRSSKSNKLDEMFE